jgi:hypothetical protein
MNGAEQVDVALRAVDLPECGRCRRFARGDRRKDEEQRDDSSGTCGCGTGGELRIIDCSPKAA